MSPGRIILAAITLSLVGIAARFAFLSHHYSRAFHAAWTAELADVSIDLTVRGETRTLFKHTCGYAHGAHFYLIPTSSPVPPDRQRQPCAELHVKATLTLLDADGRCVWTEDVDPIYSSLPATSPTSMARGHNAIDLAELRVLPTGDYTLVTHVLIPEAASPSSPQRIVARYQLCGLERMPVFVAGVIAAVALLTSLPFGFFAFRRGTRPDLSPAPTIAVDG